MTATFCCNPCGGFCNPLGSANDSEMTSPMIRNARTKKNNYVKGKSIIIRNIHDINMDNHAGLEVIQEDINSNNIDKWFLLCYGYIRIQNNYKATIETSENNVKQKIIHIIRNYCKLNDFMDTIVTDQPLTVPDDAKIVHTIYRMPTGSNYQFNDQCKQCNKKQLVFMNCIEYQIKQTRQNTIKSIENEMKTCTEEKICTEKYIVNEYECENCNYFTAHKVKSFECLQPEEDRDFGKKRIVSPWNESKYEIVDSDRQLSDEKCDQCGLQMISLGVEQLPGSFQNNKKEWWYCEWCQLYHCNEEWNHYYD